MAAKKTATAAVTQLHPATSDSAAGEATELLDGPGGDIAAAAAWAALAQAHATLAGAAAGIATHLGMTAATEEAWRDATGLARPGRRPVIEGTTEPGPEGGGSR